MEKESSTLWGCVCTGNGVHIMSDLFTPRVNRELLQFDDGDDNADNITLSTTTLGVRG